jgi:hypothetical protein
VLVVWLFGPRAAAVLAARFHKAGQGSPPVLLDRVGFVATPAWLQGPMLLAVVRDLEPCLRGSLPILDDAAANELQAQLQSLPWVAGARLQRVFPDRLRLSLELREPVLLVRDAAQRPLCCLDRTGIAMPPVDLALPVTRLGSEGGPVPTAFETGVVFPDARAVAAAKIAVEWREQVAPLVPGCPELVEVDANNLGERWLLGPRHPEIRVGLRSGTGTAVFAYDRPVDAALPRIPHATKAMVLRAILAEHPGLSGLTGGDLRLPVRWRDWLLPRAGPDPAGPFPAAAAESNPK